MPPLSEQPIQNPETQGTKAPELVSIPEKAVEVAPTLIAPEKPAENFNDQATPAPIQPQIPTVSPDPVTTQPVTPVAVDDTNPTENLDKQWVEAVETIIDKNEDKPYEEEEAAEKLSIDYLWKRFKRKIGKDDN